MIRIAIPLTLLVALSASARADDGAVLVVSRGDVSARGKVLAAAAVSDAVRAGGWPVVERSFAATEAEKISECLNKSAPWACMSSIVQSKRLARLAVLSLEKGADNGGTMIVLTERIVATSLSSAVNGHKFCDPCTDDKLQEAAAELTDELLKAIALRNPAVLSVRSTPTAARVYVDGAMVGVTDSTFKVAPGAHTVVVGHVGFENQTRLVDCVADTTTDVTVMLQAPSSSSDTSQGPPNAANAANTTPTTEQHSRVLPGVLFGVGVAAVIGGGVAIAFNQNQSSQSQDPTHVQPRRLYHTIAPGVGVAAGGALMAIFGGYLWHRYSNASSAPTVTATTGGAMFGWASNF